MAEHQVRKQWREKHRTSRGSAIRGGMGPLRLSSGRSRALALGAIALTSAVLGATVTGQVFAYKMSKRPVAQLPVKPAEPAIQTTTVVVAARPLRFGETLDSSKIRAIKWPAGQVPAGAFRTLEDVLVDGKQRSVLSAIEIDEPVLGAKVTGPGERATLAAVVDPDMRAITVSVDEILGVAGFVLPGDRVDVLLTRPVTAGDPLSIRSDVLLQDVKVLAIDQIADDRLENPAVSRAVTLQVNPEMAQKLVLGNGIGKLSLLLRPAGVSDRRKTGPVVVSDLAGGGGSSATINVIRGRKGVVARSAPADPAVQATAPAAPAQGAAVAKPPARVPGAISEKR